MTLTVVGWIDVFSRREYGACLIRNLRYCQEKKGLQLYAYCILSSHLHLVASVETGLLSTLLRDFKSFTAKELLRLIQDNPQESRKDWMLYLFRYFGRKNCQNDDIQFWQQSNHPVDLVTPQMIDQRVNYIHQNPAIAGLVNEPQDYVYSSANPASELEMLPLKPNHSIPLSRASSLVAAMGKTLACAAELGTKQIY